MLSDAATGFRKSKVYSQIGVGVLIKNENLILNTFQLSLSFYPIIPDQGNNIFKINSLSTADFGFRDFEIGNLPQLYFDKNSRFQSWVCFCSYISSALVLEFYRSWSSSYSRSLLRSAVISSCMAFIRANKCLMASIPSRLIFSS